MRITGMLGLVPIIAVLMGVSIRLDVQPPSGCDHDTDWREYLRKDVELTVTATGAAAQAWRDTLGVTQVPASQIVAVTNDSLCARAGGLMNAAFSLSALQPRTVVLIKVGAKYWAVDKTMEYAGRPYIFILDSALTTVTKTAGY